MVEASKRTFLALALVTALAGTAAGQGRAPFTDDPLVPGVTPVKAVHFTELRARIEALREAAGLARSSWTDPLLTARVTPIRVTHLLELREALAEVYAAAGERPPRWTDAAPSLGTTPIRAVHIMELRAAAMALVQRPHPEPPVAPRSLQITVSEAYGVTLTWEPSPKATSYVVELGTASGASDVLNRDLGSPDTQLIWNEPPAGELFARVRARNVAGTSPPSNESSARVFADDTCGYSTYKPLMEQVSTVGPVCITASSQVPPRALVETGRMLETMLANRGDIGRQMRDVGALTAVFGRTESVCDLPYFRDLVGSASCLAEGGLGGVPGRPATACSEKNVLMQPDDPFGRGSRPDGENVCVHELAHTIMNVGLSSEVRRRIRARFNDPDTKELWRGDYALENADEFFAEMTQAYFCANPEVPGFLHTHGINCADELHSYDTVTYGLIDSIFGGAADIR